MTTTQTANPLIHPGRPATLVDDNDVTLNPEAAPDAAPESRIARPSGINVGGHTVTAATEHLAEDQRDLVRWLHNHAKSRGLQWQELAAKVDLSSSTISRIFTDQYRYPREKVERDREGNITGRTPLPNAGQRIPLDPVCAKIKKFKRQMESEGKTDNPEFVETSVFQEIEWLYGRVSRHHRMGFVYGDGQVGKSTALKEITHRNNGGRTCYAEIPPASGVQLMLKVIAKSLDVPQHKGFDVLLEDVLLALDESKTLIIDEVHRVFTTYQRTSVMRCLDTLRYLHDQRKCGLILCGTNVFRDKVREGEFKNFLKQFHRRGRSYELQLPAVAPWKDVLKIADWFGLGEPTAQARPIVETIIRTDGIGVFRMRLVDAQDFAANKRVTLQWSHFVSAYGITARAAAVKDNLPDTPAETK